MAPCDSSDTIVTGLAGHRPDPARHASGRRLATQLSQVLTIGAIALILALINTIVKPLLSFLAFPITCLTLGLFQLVINTPMLLLAGWASGLVPDPSSTPSVGAAGR